MPAKELFDVLLQKCVLMLQQHQSFVHQASPGLEAELMQPRRWGSSSVGTEQLPALWLVLKGSTEQSRAPCSAAAWVGNQQLVCLDFTLRAFSEKLKPHLCVTGNKQK